MSDEAWRRADRAWRQAPDDQALLEAAILARRRAGLGVPPDLLDARRRPPVRLELPDDAPPGAWLAVLVRGGDGPGYAGRLARRGDVCVVGEHAALWVEPRVVGHAMFDDDAIARVLALVGELRAPGLSIDLRLVPPGWHGHLRRAAARARALRVHRRRDQGPEVDDDALRAIGALEGLVELEVDAGPYARGAGLTPSGVAALSGLTRLERLTLHVPGGHALAMGLGPLAASPLLSALDIHAPLDEEALRAVARLPALGGLRLVAPRSSAAPRVQVPEERWRGLARLDLHGLTLDDGAARALGRCEDLARLSLVRCEPPRDWRWLAALPALRSLHIDGQARLGAHALRAMAACRRLRELHLGPSGTIDLDAAGALADLSPLDLGLSGIDDPRDDRAARLDDVGLERLARAVRLSGLDLFDQSRVTWSGVTRALALQPDLERLMLEVREGAPGDADATLAGAGRLSRLVAFTAWGPFGDAALEGLAASRSLRDLGLGSSLGSSDATFTGPGLARLAAVPTLRGLSLLGCDQLGEGDVDGLAALHGLRRLVLPRPLRARRLVARLASALPGCAIDVVDDD